MVRLGDSARFIEMHRVILCVPGHLGHLLKPRLGPRTGEDQTYKYNLPGDHVHGPGAIHSPSKLHSMIGREGYISQPLAFQS